MDPFIVNLVGGGAATLTTICWLPQAFKILRTQNTRAISLLTYSVFAAGLVLMLMTLGLNVIGHLLRRRYREVY